VTATASEKVRGGPPGMPLVSVAAYRRHLAAEAELRNAGSVARAAKVQTRELAKAGSHAVLGLPDMHFPYQDEACEAIVLKAAEVIRPRRIVSYGDLLDCANWTRHPAKAIADKALHKYRAEVELAGRFLDRLIEAAGGVGPGGVQEVVIVSGNHEHRVEARCVELGALGESILEYVSPERLLTAGRPWLRWVPYVEPFAQDRLPPGQRGGGMPHYKIARDLWAVHGWSIARNAAAKHLEMAGTVSIVHGHTHRQQEAAKRSLVDDRIVRAWSPGCLSQLQPAWRHSAPTDWVHGFDAIYVEDDALTNPAASWQAHTVTIDRGRCVLPGGTSVRA
jgi:hypothetical protein